MYKNKVIKVAVVITTIINDCLLIVKYWITNHLGINPKKGGNPPKESMFKNRDNFKIFESINIENSWFIWMILKALKNIIKLVDKRE